MTNAVPFWVQKTTLYTFACISAVANCALIYLVTHASNRNLGNYRILLGTFATVDIAISLFHAVIIPEYAVVEYGFAVFAYNGLHLNSLLGNALLEAYIALFYQPFILLTFHFFYRLMSVIRPDGLQSHFWKGLAVAIVVDVAVSMIIVFEVKLTLQEQVENFFYKVMLRDYHVDLSADPKPNLIPVHYFHAPSFGGGPNWNSIISMMTCGSIGAVTFVFNATCGIIIVKRIDKLHISLASRHFHLQLLRALIIQFTVPIVLCVLPFFMVMGLPLTGLPFGLTGNIMSLFVSFFPVVDPICMILAYSKFRSMIVDGLLRVMIKATPSDISMTTMLPVPALGAPRIHPEPSASHHISSTEIREQEPIMLN